MPQVSRRTFLEISKLSQALDLSADVAGAMGLLDQPTFSVPVFSDVRISSHTSIHCKPIARLTLQQQWRLIVCSLVPRDSVAAEHFPLAGNLHGRVECAELSALPCWSRHQLRIADAGAGQHQAESGRFSGGNFYRRLSWPRRRPALLHIYAEFNSRRGKRLRRQDTHICFTADQSGSRNHPRVLCAG